MHPPRPWQRIQSLRLAPGIAPCPCSVVRGVPIDPAALPVGGDRPVVLQCGSGKRSGMALDLCRKAGVDVAGHLAGGIGAWRAAGLPVIRIDPATGAVRDVR